MGKINFSSCSLKLGSGEVHRHVWIHTTGPLVSTSWQYHALDQLRELQLQPELLCPSCQQSVGGHCTGASGLGQRVTLTSKAVCSQVWSCS